MKLKVNYALRQVADTWVVLPLGTAAVDFNGMLALNESAAFLWKELEQNGNRETMADALCREYDVARAEALADVDEFLAKLADVGCLEA